MARLARTLEEAETWIWEQVAPTPATVVEGRGGDLGYVVYLLEERRRRQKPRHRALLTGAPERRVKGEQAKRGSTDGIGDP